MTNLVLLRDALFVAGCGILGLAFVLLLWLYQRITGSRRAAQVRTGPSLTETAILFQTLRGVVDDQKMLARRFNESVDRKVTLMREVIKRLLEEHEKLTQAHEDLIRQQDEVRRELAALREEAARLKSDLSTAPSGLPPRDASDATKTKPAPVPKAAPLTAIAEPIEAPASNDWLDTWAGFDFVIDDKAPEPVEEPEPFPPLPGHSEVNREEVRALLGAGPETAQASSDDDESDAGSARPGSASLRGRVFAYHDAGMSVAQIARELGIGKGEVRLMINLRDKGIPEA